MGSKIKVPEWLLRMDRPLDMSGPDWREKQKQLLALPKFGVQPADDVREYLETCAQKDERGRFKRPELPDEDHLEEDQRLPARVTAHLKKDLVAFMWHLAVYQSRETRAWSRGNLTPGQILMVWAFHILWHAGRPIRLILLKERRSGSTWCWGNIDDWVVLFHENRAVIMTGNTKRVSGQALRYMVNTYNLLPREIKPTKKYLSKDTIYLEETDPAKIEEGDYGLHCELSAQTVGTDYVGTGDDAQGAHLAEVGKYEKACDPDVQFTSMTNTIPEAKHSFIVMESTAHGANTFFHQHCKAAQKHGAPGWSGYIFMFIPWYFDPRNDLPEPPDMELCDDDDAEYGNEVQERLDYNLTLGQLFWRRAFIQKQSANTDRVATFKQEHPGNPLEAWLYAGGLFIPIRVSQALQERIDEDRTPLFQGFVDHKRHLGPKLPFSAFFREDPRGDIRIFEMPRVGWEYLVGTDVSTGQALDNSCAKVYRRHPDDGLILAAELYGKYLVTELAQVLWRLGHFYNTAMQAWERTGAGSSIAESLRSVAGLATSPYPSHRMFRAPSKRIARVPEARYGIDTHGASKRLYLNLWLEAAGSGYVDLLPEDLVEASALTLDDRGRVDTQGRDRFMATVMAAVAHNYMKPPPAPKHGPEFQAREGTVLHLLDRHLRDGEDEWASDVAPLLDVDF